MDLGPAYGHAFFFEREPWRNVGIVIETRDQNFVAGAKVAATSPAKARDMANVSVVMFGPKTISSALQLRKSAMAARAYATTASVRRLVA